MYFKPLLLSLVAAQALPALGSGSEQQPLRAEKKPIESIPQLGFGTWRLDPSNASDVVAEAIKVGYRHIDGAKIYGNQVSVGHGIAKGLRAQHLARQDIWVTSKLWNDRHVDDLSPGDAEKEVESALKQTLTELGLEYVDLYLMHFPVSARNGETKVEYLNTWKALTKLPSTGMTRFVGISNVTPAQLSDILKATPDFKPYAHQLESHPYLPQTEWIAHNRDLGIYVTAYSPLGNSNPTYTMPNKGDPQYIPPLLENDVLVSIARQRNCTSAQVALKWGLNRGTQVIPKSQHAERIAENWKSAACALDARDELRLSEELATKRFNDPFDLFGDVDDEKFDGHGSHNRPVQVS